MSDDRSSDRLLRNSIPRPAQGPRPSKSTRESGRPTLHGSNDDKRTLDPEHDEGKRIDRTININDLPPELLCDILKIASRDTESLAFEFAICASHISRWWRELVLGTPKLWRRIDAESGSKIVTLCLARSKQAPLDVRIYLNPTITETKGVNRIKRFTKLIAPERHRFRTFTFHYYYPSWLEAGSPLLTSEQVIEVDTLDVRRLDFASAPMQEEGPIVVIPMDQITFAPRHLRYDGINIPEDYTFIPGFSASLRSLDIRWSLVRAPMEDLMPMLSDAANLEYLRLTGLKGHASKMAPPDPDIMYCFPSLREVVFESLSGRRLWDLVTWMWMPALERLLIDPTGNLLPGPIILRICEKSPRLQYFRLNATFCLQTPTLHTIFSNLPSLTDLYLFQYGSEDRPHDLDCLIADPTSPEPVLCPKLTSVTFDCSEGVHKDFVVQLVMSRMDITGVSPIRSLRWKSISWKTATELCEELHEPLRANILDLVLECTSYPDSDVGSDPGEEDGMVLSDG